MKIRAARIEDLERLLELYREPNELYAKVEELGYDEAERVFEEVLGDEHQRTLVAEEDGEIVGTLVVAILPNLAHGGSPYAVVENVVVDGACRGEGIGTAMMREALKRAREAGAYKLTLSANVGRERAHGFYEALGMKQTHAGFEVKP